MSDTITLSSSSKRIQALALLATGRTGADIELLVREVRQKARRDKRELTWSDIEQALGADRMVMGDDLRWRVSVHEAGHAMAWTLLRIGEVASVTLGLEQMGQVTVDRYRDLPQTEEWLTRTMAAILAGRVAELLVIGEPMVGSGGGEDSDLAKATAIALDAETRLGMAEHQPLLYRPSNRGFDILSLDRDLAERVNKRLLAAETIAHNLLEEQGGELMRLASHLSQSGVMSGNEVREMLGIAPDYLEKEDGETRL